jgi:hypothetical protein
VVHEGRPGANQLPRRVGDHENTGGSLTGTQAAGHDLSHPQCQVTELLPEERRADDVERQRRHGRWHLDLEPVAVGVLVGDEGLDRLNHQTAHALDVTFGHHRVEHHAVAAP